MPEPKLPVFHPSGSHLPVQGPSEKLIGGAARAALWLTLWMGSLAITLSSLVYFNLNELPPFVIEKLPLPAEDLYLLALRLHVIAAAFALPGCLVLASKSILKRWPVFHRRCGRLVGILIMAILVPSGFYLAFFARGGWAGTFGFLLSGAIVMMAMVQGIRAARRKRFAAHRRFALHVLGQLSVAVTSRALLYVLESSNIDPDSAYLFSLWIPVLGTFAFVEFTVPPTHFPSFLRRLYEQMVDYPVALRGRRAGIR